MYKVNTQVETSDAEFYKHCLTESRVMFRKEYRLVENKDTSFYVIQGIHQAALSSSVHLLEHSSVLYECPRLNTPTGLYGRNSTSPDSMGDWLHFVSGKFLEPGKGGAKNAAAREEPVGGR